MKRLSIILTLFLIFSACSSQANEEKDIVEVHTRQAEVIAKELQIPWNITKHDNYFYLSQRPGSILKVDEASGSKMLQDVFVTKEIHHEGEGGLLGFILAPDFKQTKEAFAYHTYRQAGETFNRIIVLQLETNTWKETRIILEGIPGGRIHNGGRIKIGPDGTLYATAGDAGIPELAQQIENLGGKILRMQLDGSIPNDNPFKNSYVYSYGHRTPQGLDWDVSGTLYSSEHGQSAHDEINLIEAGKNYGWPEIQGDEEAADMVTPFFQTGDSTWAPSGIAIKGNKLYVATLRGESIRVLDLKNGNVDILYEGTGRMRDVLIENNNLYTITNNLDGRGDPREGDDHLFKILLNE